jgi:hypothetical protein
MNTITGVDHPIYQAVVSRLRQQFGPGPPTSHACQSSSGCFSQAIAEGPSWSRNIFFLRCHTVHLCSENTCQFYGADPTGTCPVSGIQYGTIISNYDKNDSRTWYSRPYLEGSAPSAIAATAPIKRASPQALSDECKRECASGVIRLLLWSIKRGTRNTRVHELRVKESGEACSNYIKNQLAAHQPPFWTDLYRIQGYMMSKHPMLQILQYDETLHDYYVAIICQVWDRVVRFRPDTAAEKMTRSDLEAVSIGVLYGMRQTEYRCRGVIILSKDDFLEQELPPISELGPYYGVERNRVTQGQKIFRAAFDNAFSKGVPHSEIELDMAAVTREAASKVAPETAIVTRDARNRQVKITNKGEVLFMPVSRKKQSK